MESEPFEEAPLEDAVRKLAEMTGQSEGEIYDWIRRQEEAEQRQQQLREAAEIRSREAADIALRDEEHCVRTVQLMGKVIKSSEFIRGQLASGEMSLDELGTIASFTISNEVTDRHFGASKAVGKTAAGLIGQKDV